MRWFVLLSLSWMIPFSQLSPQSVDKGLLSLKSWSGNEISLHGIWKFYPNESILIENPRIEDFEQFSECKILASNQISKSCRLDTRREWNFLKTPPLYINIPEDWAQIRDQIGTETTRGIYRLDFEDPSVDEVFIASRNFAGYSVNLWIMESSNNDIVYIGSSYLRQDSNLNYRNKKFGFVIPPKTKSILIEVDSNQMSARLGIVNQMYLMDQKHSSLFYSKIYTFTILSVGLFFGFFLFYLVQYVLDFKLEYFYFSIVCIVFAIRILALDSFHLLFSEDNYILNDFFLNSSYWTGSYIICFYYLFLKRILETKQKFKTDKLFFLISSSFVIYLHFPGEFRGVEFIPILNTYVIIFFALILRLLIKNFNSKKEHIKYVSRIMVAYLIIFASTAFNDFLLAYGKITGMYLSQYGFFFLLMGQIIIIATRNKNIRIQNEKLNFDLKKEYREKKDLLISKDELVSAIDKIKKDLQKAENQLIQANKMSTLGTMMAGISHEINNPMQFIDSNRYLIEEEVKKIQKMISSENNAISFEYIEKIEEIQNRLNNIHIGTRKITELNRSMMNLTRMDYQIMSKERISEVLRETLLILDFKLKYHEIIINMDQSLELRCHRGQIGQVLMNILSNSADAISEKSNKKGKILLSTLVNKENVILTVEDSGVGIPDHVKERVFEGFFTTKNIEKGTGLGLSITRKIMEIHNGTISLDKSSELGGAKIILSFPRD
jgi:two-component system NtrC family sensor kinase